MRIRLSRTATVPLTALASAVAIGFTTTPTAMALSKLTATTTGRVCMFDAPNGAFWLGHVAWAYRWSDGSGTWDYGATSESRNWRKHGSEQQMLQDFTTSTEGGGYRGYRCKDTAAGDQNAASAAVTAGTARSYNLTEDNCLTRSVEIFKAYDGSGGLNGLPDGKWIFPNAYFNYDLAGWGDEQKL